MALWMTRKEELVEVGQGRLSDDSVVPDVVLTPRGGTSIHAQFLHAAETVGKRDQTALLGPFP